MDIKFKVMAMTLSALFLAGHASADVIRLKNGNKVEGIIIEERDGTVTVQLDAGTMIFSPEEIKSVERSDDAEKAALEKRWKEEKTQAKKTAPVIRPKQASEAKSPEPARVRAPSSISWRYDLEDGLAEAKRTDKPVMADFYTDWCGWCKKLDEDTYKDKDVLALAAGFVCVKIDADKDKESAKKYKVSGYPTIIFFNPAGNEIGRIGGYLPGEDFASRMKDFLK